MGAPEFLPGFWKVEALLPQSKATLPCQHHRVNGANERQFSSHCEESRPEGALHFSPGCNPGFPRFVYGCVLKEHRIKTGDAAHLQTAHCLETLTRACTPGWDA